MMRAFWLFIAFFSSHQVSWGQSLDRPQERVPTANWMRDNTGQETLLVRLSQHLTPRQRKLIDSGFSTYSEITLRSIDIPKSKRVIKTQGLELRCTVRFDAWEEQYDVARIQTTVDTIVVKSFDAYAERCLAITFVDQELIHDFATKGATIVMNLQLNQIAPERAQEIKAWLVKQQSGVMQGLFAHMLGDLNLSEKILVKVIVPPRLTVAKPKANHATKP